MSSLSLSLYLLCLGFSPLDYLPGASEVCFETMSCLVLYCLCLCLFCFVFVCSLPHVSLHAIRYSFETQLAGLHLFVLRVRVMVRVRIRVRVGQGQGTGQD
jgi:hypothetical protein